MKLTHKISLSSAEVGEALANYISQSLGEKSPKAEDMSVICKGSLGNPAFMTREELVSDCSTLHLSPRGGAEVIWEDPVDSE